MWQRSIGAPDNKTDGKFDATVSAQPETDYQSSQSGEHSKSQKLGKGPALEKESDLGLFCKQNDTF